MPDVRPDDREEKPRRTVTVRALASRLEHGFGEVAALYREAFPASERKPAEFLARAAEAGDYALLCAESCGATVGMSVVYRSTCGRFALLEYMAVGAPWRGMGLGRSLFGAVAARVGMPLLLEVESERPEAPGAALRSRRIAFYRALGCRAVAGLDYRMPSVSDAPPPPMCLLVHGWNAATIDRACLAAWLEEVYHRVYDRSADDPGLRAMQAQLSDPVMLA